VSVAARATETPHVTATAAAALSRKRLFRIEDSSFFNFQMGSRLMAVKFHPEFLARHEGRTALRGDTASREGVGLERRTIRA
jgi:hypothetical protein